VSAFAEQQVKTSADDAPRSAHLLVGGTFRLYRRYSLLFLVLAAGVIVPYEAIVLAATGSGPLTRSSVGIGVSTLLTLTDWALVSPLISALHVHAVSEMREGGEPRLGPVARQGLRALPVVAVASVVSWLGITVGFILIVPGVLLMLRWAVVAQAAAIEHEGWLQALRRSHWLTDGHYRHIFVFIVYITLIVSVPTLLIGLAFDSHETGAASFLVGLAVNVVVYSFGALATALLYYDLRVRREAVVADWLDGYEPRSASPPRPVE
jgi:hypothetical protein